MTARIAVYYAPMADDPLTAASAHWLGRDPVTNAPVAQPDIPDIEAITADARMYGFHATLKPPMRLAAGHRWDELLAATRAMAASLKPFDLPPLAVMDLHGFLALRETVASPELQHLADVCVERLDAFREPPPADELARRRRSNLTAEEDAMLVRWGYPYVFGTWFFHMTLTRRLTPDEKALYQPRAEAHFAEAIRHRRRVTDICLYTQAGPGAPFTIAERLPLLG
jgi:putative phosphonate metabolism protein